jgi:hypothetical protein
MLGDSPFRRRVQRFISATNRTEAFEAAARRVLADYPAHSAMVARTRVEQAVLDAWGEVHTDMLHVWATHPSERVRNVCRAELARRGLK